MTRVPDDRQYPTLLTEAFRTFFMGGATFGVFSMVVWLSWLGVHAAGAVATYVPFSPPPHQWHAHEMIFGYGAAIVAGFLLTAVPSWTGAAPSRAAFVTGAAAVWLAGRLAVLFSGELPALVVLAIDLAFLPVLGLNILMNLLKRPKIQNLIFLGLLAALTAANLAVHLEWANITSDTASGGLKAGLLTLAALIAVLGGRITPAFTKNAMVRSGTETGLPKSRNLADVSGTASAILLALLVGFDPGDMVLGSIAALAAVSNALRLSGWRTMAIVDQPILWSLHLGFAMLTAGYAALAIHWFGFGLSEAASIHLIAIGAVGGMTLAVMSRAALGHTGRPLTVSATITAAYALVALAALVRSVGVSFAPDHYFLMIFVAGGLWIVSFVIFIAVYAPICMAPRLQSHG